jgi:hypothetical protein
MSNEDILKIGFNSCLKSWNNDSLLVYSKTLTEDKKKIILSNNNGFPLKESPLTSRSIGKLVFKRYNVSTMLLKLKDYERSGLF